MVAQTLIDPNMLVSKLVTYSTDTGQNLDIQYTVGAVQGVPITFISVGPNNRDGFKRHLDFAQYLLSMPQPPQVVTTSYGFDESNVDPRFAIFASGDGGVGREPTVNCPLYAGKFNPNGCTFPNVTTQAVNVEPVNGGKYENDYGTSAASLMFASVIALLNDQCITTRNRPLGFLNPLLYANPSILNDITSDSNPNRFSSIDSWDPVTGLGTPNYTTLRRVVGVGG
ncbi:hypothetical protein PILCRDRAFT_92878 [Piloderma croceum F 1598]|uniref:Peptidase S53 domain-containing protein n=1 Tax=Piloderma croceum (strain F 1598) TaxID=765440 RepID=A0A0C3F1H7_PILCF|nr:hypothetical protein PILCRDRAFT_92878 [Piloderma croceum F 1598]